MEKLFKKKKFWKFGELPWLLNQHSFLLETRVVMTTPTWEEGRRGGCEQLRISICNTTEVTATKWSLASNAAAVRVFPGQKSRS